MQKNMLEFVRAVLGDQECLAVDCGAAGGISSHWKCLIGNAHFLLFEPDDESYQHLAARDEVSSDPSRWDLRNTGLSKDGGAKTLYRFNTGTGSSLLPPDTVTSFIDPAHPYVFPITEVTVETVSLAGALDEGGYACADFLKIDVQGTEMDVLRGLGDRIDETLSIEVEVLIMPTYIGQSSFDQVYALLREHGFEMFDLCKWPQKWDYPLYRGRHDVSAPEILDVPGDSGTVLHPIHELDLLFFREPEGLLRAKDPAAIRRLLVAYCTYGFFFVAISVNRQAVAREVYDAGTGAKIERGIVEWHALMHRSAWQGNHSFANLIQRASAKLKSILYGRNPKWAGDN